MAFGRAQPRRAPATDKADRARHGRAGRGMDPVVGAAAVAAACAHLVYGGLDVVLAAAAFSATWRLGVAVLDS